MKKIYLDKVKKIIKLERYASLYIYTFYFFLDLGMEWHVIDRSQFRGGLQYNGSYRRRGRAVGRACN